MLGTRLGGGGDGAADPLPSPLLPGEELAKDELQYPAVPVVEGLLGGVDPHKCREFHRPSPLPHYPHFHAPPVAAARNGIAQSFHVENVLAGQSKRLDGVARAELQRQNPHSDEIRAVDAFVAFGDHHPDPLQMRPFGRPVAARPRAVLLPRKDDEGRPLFLVPHGGIIDRHDLAARQMPGESPLDLRDEAVADAHVGEGATHHHLMVAAPRAVGVEIPLLHPPLDEIRPGRRILFDASGGGDVVGRHAVAEESQDPRPPDLLHFVGGLLLHSFEKGRLTDVGRIGTPRKAIALCRIQSVPAVVPLVDPAVGVQVHLRTNPLLDGLPDLFGCRPDVAQVDGIAVPIAPQRFALQVDVDAPGEGEGDDERGGHEVVGPHLGIDASLEVAVPRKDRGDDQGAASNRLGNLGRKRPGVADAGGAAVAGDVEAELFEIPQEPRPFIVVRHHP